LLANDPHLGLSAPAIWYFARLQAPASRAADGSPVPGIDVIGATFPGLPFVVLGRTARVAWGVTNTGPDVQDLYLEQINPANPKQYKTPDGWADFKVRTEVFKVKGKPDVSLAMRETRHGPVLSDAQASHAELLDLSRYVLALRWSALDADNQTVVAGINANRAQSVDELLAAFEHWHSPMQNAVAADVTGRVAYKAIGRVPLRRADNDIRGVAPSPGWDARYDWAGWIPYAETPQDDPAETARKGWHATANQRITPAGYPHFMGQDWNDPYRYERIEQLLAATPRHDAASMRMAHGDQRSLATLRLLPTLQKATSSHPLASAAQAQLKGFDGVMRAGSAAPLIFSVWADELTRGLIAPRLGEDRFKALYGKRQFRLGVEGIMARNDAWWCAPKTCEAQSGDALGRALDRIQAQLGGDVASWQWGELHQALSGHRPFGNVAPLAKFFDVRVPTGGDNFTVNVGQYWPNDPKVPFANRHAASLRAVYDLADLEKSQFIYQTGQSGLVFSRRYNDMSAEWAAVTYRPLQLNPASFSHTLRLNP
jgi:penicillin amidase